MKMQIAGSDGVWRDATPEEIEFFNSPDIQAQIEILNAEIEKEFIRPSPAQLVDIHAEILKLIMAKETKH